MIRSFNTGNIAAVGTLKLADYDWEIGERLFMLCGSDSFSIVTYDGIILARWSLAATAVSPLRHATATGANYNNPLADSDGDGAPNVFEQLIATSPMPFDPNPVQLTTTVANNSTVVHLTFPRKAGMAMPAYGDEISRNRATWEPVEQVAETVLSTRTIDGVAVETVDAAIVAPAPELGFVRRRWLQA